MRDALADAIKVVSDALRVCWDTTYGPAPDFDALARIACRALWPSLDAAFASTVLDAHQEAEEALIGGGATPAASVVALTNGQLDERIKRLLQDLSALHPELTDALEDAVWLRYGIDL